MDRPIKPLPASTTLQDLCSSPTKKCALLLTPAGKTDRTAHDYLKEVAVGFINEYLFFEVELECNSELETLAKKSALLVYHPRTSQYVALKAKLSKTTFQKFLKANLADSKKLPLHSLPNEKLELTKCQAPSPSTQSEEL
uniref:Predicted protein n=1 Tax=Hordeum vulgare subsp. vulgare TaxID=112509 RepID=F2E1R1_HORVV|nr:predicted protein [Hordeum vulgare subsp. vulgare]